MPDAANPFVHVQAYFQGFGRALQRMVDGLHEVVAASLGAQMLIELDVQRLTTVVNRWTAAPAPYGGIRRHGRQKLSGIRPMSDP
jgi:hypothetical protein